MLQSLGQHLHAHLSKPQEQGVRAMPSSQPLAWPRSQLQLGLTMLLKLCHSTSHYIVAFSGQAAPAVVHF